MPPYTILMFVFSIALLLYAGLLALTKNYDLLPVRARISVNPKNKKAYTFQFSKTIAVAAAVPALTGLVAVWNGFAAGIVFILGLIAALWIATKIMKNVE